MTVATCKAVQCAYRRILGEFGYTDVTDYLVYMTDHSGVDYVHEHVFSGSSQGEEFAFDCSRMAREDAEAFAAKVLARGVANPIHWVKALGKDEDFDSLEERYEPFGPEWQREQAESAWL